MHTDYEEEISLTKKINVHFDDLAILRQALTHRSFLNENRGNGVSHNERLEFLGDAVLELVMTDHLFHKYPERTEGELTSYRAALVNTESIAEAAEGLGLNDFLYLSKGEARDTGKARHYILADAYEALVGALYLDQGYDAARSLIERTLYHKIDAIVANELWKDAKSRFQEKAQEVASVTPSYRVLREEGPDHEKDFTVGVYLSDDMVAEGTGRSKQDAEQDAASNAIEVKGW